MKFSRRFVVLALVLLPALVVAQILDTTWSRRYDGPRHADDVVNAMAVSPGGTVTVTGTSAGTATNDDYATALYNTDGVEQWIQRYNSLGTSLDMATAAAIDGDGNVIVTGQGGFTPYLFINTVKYSPAGNVLWSNRFDGLVNTGLYANAMTLDADNNIYIVGYANHPTGTDADWVILKYDPNGNIVWTNSYGSVPGGEDKAVCLALGPAGSLYVGGSANGSFALGKFDADGQRLWVSTWTIEVTDVINAIAVDGSGNVYGTGCYMIAGPSGHWNYETAKYDANGGQLWTQIYNGTGSRTDIAIALALDRNGDCIITGYSFGGGGPDLDYLTIKYNSTGGVVWTERYNGTADGVDVPYGMVVDTAGRIYITGVSAGSGGTNEILTICYNPDKTTRWYASYNGPGNNDDVGKAIGLDADLNTYVGGITYDTTTKYNYVVLKYSSSLDGVAQEVVKPARPALSVSPAPVRSSGLIRYSLPRAGETNVALFDITGKQVAVLASGHQAAGAHSLPFSTGSLAAIEPGVYVVRVATESTTLTQKIVFAR